MSTLEQVLHFCRGHAMVEANIAGHYIALRSVIISPRGNTIYSTIPVMTLRDAKKVLGY